MQRTDKISSNYFINRYSIFFYILVSFIFYSVIVKRYDWKIFLALEIPVSIAYIIWLFSEGSLHFFSEAMVYRQDRNSLCLRKSGRTFLVTDRDIDSIFFYPVVFTKNRKMIIKIKLVIYTKEEFFFQIRMDKTEIDSSLIFNSDYFYRISENFWGAAEKSKIKLAENRI